MGIKQLGQTYKDILANAQGYYDSKIEEFIYKKMESRCINKYFECEKYVFKGLSFKFLHYPIIIPRDMKCMYGKDYIAKYVLYGVLVRKSIINPVDERLITRYYIPLDGIDKWTESNEETFLKYVYKITDIKKR